MNKKNLIYAILHIFLLGLLLAQADNAFSKGRHGPRGRSFGGMHGGFGKIERLASKLDLTDDQVAAMKNQRSTSKKQAIQMRADLQVARVELHDLLDAEKPNAGQVKSQVEKMGEMRTALMLNHVQTRLQMKEILTEEQFQKLKKLRMEMKGGRGRPGHGHGRRGPGFLGEHSFDFDNDGEQAESF